MRTERITRIKRIETIQALVVVLATLVVAMGASAQIAVPNATNFQGILLDSDGIPMTGTVDLDIGVWNQLAGGSLLYRELHQNVTLDRGVFDVVIGDGDILISGSYGPGIFEGVALYLEVAVDAEVLSPRQPFDTVGYAFKAEVARSVAPNANLNLDFVNYNANCGFGSCPETASSSFHNFCALTRTNVSPPGTFHRCTVTADGDGTFTLQADASESTFLECRMSCF